MPDCLTTWAHLLPGWPGPPACGTALRTTPSGTFAAVGATGRCAAPGPSPLGGSPVCPTLPSWRGRVALPPSMSSACLTVLAHPRPLPPLLAQGVGGVPAYLFGLLWSSGGGWQRGGGLRAHQPPPLRLLAAAPGPAPVRGAAASGAVVRSTAPGCGVHRGGCYPLRGRDWASTVPTLVTGPSPPLAWLLVKSGSCGTRAVRASSGARGAEPGLTQGGGLEVAGFPPPLFSSGPDGRGPPPLPTGCSPLLWCDHRR